MLIEFSSSAFIKVLRSYYSRDMARKNRHVVFGEVAEGMEVVSAVEAVGSPSGRPSKPVTATASDTV